MSNELKHKTKGSTLTRSEFEHIDLHVLDSQATNDLIYASSSTQLSRLPVVASRIIARLASGGVVAATVAQIKTLLGVGSASGIASLNGSTKVVEQPASISDFLESSPSNGESGKAPDSNWAFDFEAQKAAASGLASLNAGSKVVEQPASITDHLDDTAGGTNAEVTKAPTSNVMYDFTAQKAAASGLASLDSDTRLVESAKTLADADDNTKFQIEEGADDNHARVDTGGVEVGLWHDNGIFELAKQSRARANKTVVQTIPNTTWIKVQLDTEDYDNQNEFDSSVKSGTDDRANGEGADHLIDDGNSQFAAGDVGKTVYNKTDKTYAIVTNHNDAGDLTLSAAIMANGETYDLYFSRFTATEAGTYLVIAKVIYASPVADVELITAVYKNGTTTGADTYFSSPYTGAYSVPFQDIVVLNATDYLELWTHHSGGAGETLSIYGLCFMAIHKLS